jgi:cytochrome P450
MVTRPLAFMEELRARFGEVFTVRLLQEAPWVMVSEPELIKQVFKAPAEVLHAGKGKQFLRPVLGDHSVLLLDEDRHTEQRKLLLPPFGGSRIEHYEDAMRAAAERTMEAWPTATVTAATTWTRAIALETILRAVFGVADDGRLAPLRDALRDLRVPGSARKKGASAFRSALARVDELIYAEIADRQGEAGGEVRDDVLSMLLAARHEDGSLMSSTEIRDELMTLLVAGYETTAATLAWALERLARNPAALALTEAEAADGGGPYTDAAIKETLRLRPALPVVARAVKAPFELGGHRIPPGATIVPAILLVHHRPDIYPDPMAFRPERFLDGPPAPYAWIPFGGGSRRCIGARFALLEMRVVLAALLARATVRPAEPGAEAMRCRDVTLVPSRGAAVILESR